MDNFKSSYEEGLLVSIAYSVIFDEGKSTQITPPLTDANHIRCRLSIRNVSKAIFYSIASGHLHHSRVVKISQSPDP